MKDASEFWAGETANPHHLYSIHKLLINKVSLLDSPPKLLKAVHF